MAPLDPDTLRDAVRHLHRCEATFIRWDRAREVLEGKVVFDRQVAIFDLAGHKEAVRAYAWTEPGSGGKRRFFAVLGIPPITNALAAVRASIADDARSRP
jgi:hypothetical protein